jgi:hypothetical protein
VVRSPVVVPEPAQLVNIAQKMHAVAIPVPPMQDAPQHAQHLILAGPIQIVRRRLVPLVLIMRIIMVSSVDALIVFVRSFLQQFVMLLGLTVIMGVVIYQNNAGNSFNI